jgi:hypothetical protein
MIAQLLGRAIIAFLLFSPMVAFFTFKSSEVIVHNNVAHAEEASVEESREEPREVRIVVSNTRLYDELPETLKGYPKPPFRVFDAIVNVSKELKFDWKIVYAICVHESGCGTKMIGDGGLSEGYYHIYEVDNVCEYTGFRKGCIKDNDRYDIYIATRWTVKRLLSNQDLGRYDMIRSHNGLWKDGRNADYVPAIDRLISLLP